MCVGQVPERRFAPATVHGMLTGGVCCLRSAGPPAGSAPFPTDFPTDFNLRAVKGRRRLRLGRLAH